MKFIYVILISLLSILSVEAQGVNEVRLSSSQSITDHIDVGSNSNNEGIIIKIIFDENKNEIGVSLVSYNPILAMWCDTPYRSAFFLTRLRPDKLPSANISNEKAKYKIQKAARREVDLYGKRRRRLVMQQTILCSDATPQEYPLKLVNDVIEQRFTLEEDQNELTISLGDLLMMKRRDGKKERYNIYSYDKVNKQYKVVIERDYCMNREAEIAAAEATLAAVKTSLESLQQIMNDPIMRNEEEKQTLFDKLRQIALEQFAHNDTIDRCPGIQSLIDQYNGAIESIKGLDVTLEPQRKIADYIIIRQKTKQLDKCMAILQYSHDQAERRDMQRQGKTLISEINMHIIDAEIIDIETSEAIQTFYSAESVYYELIEVNR